MAKQKARAEVNNFIKGIITESNPLTHPANASQDEENFELNRNGSRNRRLGLDYETSYVNIATPLTATTVSSAKTSTFKWLSVGGALSTDFLVVQLDTTLQFYNLNSEPLSGAGFLGSVILSEFPPNITYSLTSIEGVLVVAAGVETIAVVSYTAPTFSVTYEVLKTRDYWGVEVTSNPQYETDAAYRGVYDDQHYYNLTNQSWGIPRLTEGNVLGDPVGVYANTLGVYPSNTETVWTGLQFQPVVDGATFERVYPNLYSERLGASVLAAKGYFIIDVLRRGTSRLTEMAKNVAKFPSMSPWAGTLPSDTTTGGATVVTDFAGRVWYAGFSGDVTAGDKRSPNLSNFIFFSRLVRARADFTKCYQEGDPSSRDSTDLVDTDGGFIRISGAKTIIAMVTLSSSLVVIADNGIWHISGGADYGFSPTNYKVTQISTFGGLSKESVVREGERAFFWAADGIYVIGADQLGALSVKSITEQTIQTLYTNIPNDAKSKAFGVYDAVGKKIRWLYKTGTAFSADSVTKELILDLSINAFYQSKIGNLPNNSVEVVGSFVALPFNSILSNSSVYSALDEVYALTEPVVTAESVQIIGSQSVKYVTLSVIGSAVFLTFSFFKELTFKDWKSANGVGVDAKAFLLTGQQTATDSAIAKQIPYLIMYFNRTEVGVTPDLVPDKQSGCLMRCQWDFANSIVSNKWSALQQVYRYRRAQYIVDASDDYDNGFAVVSSKNKIRGRGKAFSLYLETEPGKDCQVLGWSVSITGNSDV